MTIDIEITCVTCGAVRTLNQMQDAPLSDEQVLGAAGHRPDCAEHAHVVLALPDQGNTRYEISEVR